MKGSSLASKTPFTTNVLFINGLNRTGKFFLGKIVSELENMEFCQYVTLLEKVPFLAMKNCIEEDTAVSLLQTTVDEYARNMYIGRNLNTRFDDGSSISNSLEKDIYLKRAQLPISETLIEDVQKTGRMSSFIIHENLSHIDLFFKAFPNMKWLNLVRHPVDVIHSWYRKGRSRRSELSPHSSVPLIKDYQGRRIQWYVDGWSDEYFNMSDIDYNIKAVDVLTKMGESAYQTLSNEQKKLVCTVSYESLVQNTHEEIDKLKTFLNTTVSKDFQIVLDRERCPQDIPISKRIEKVEEIKKVASKEKFTLMMDLADQYEKLNNTAVVSESSVYE